MPHTSSRPTGAPAHGGPATGPLHHRAARRAVLVLLLAVLPLQGALAPAPHLRDALTTIERAAPAADIPLCC
ncbi:hypothetical protein AB0C59_10530 [Streptomyces sp. NPDC048664]|uniref:hypothetical protein n=1 Tax=Streptomyces sp. NPDC048664 TaxID=3154505 RepID=UPI00343E1757